MKVFFHENDLPSAFDHTGSIAIDTETMGLSLHRDRLCLVQISTGNQECHLIHIQKDQDPPENLINLLKNPEILKIFHFARFDVAVLYNAFNILTYPIYCTKIASKLVRTYTDRHGLKDLCKEILGVEISKQEQMSDWGVVELTESQKRYAATDVLYLHKLKEHFDKILIRENRIDLAQAAFSYLPYQAKMDVLACDHYNILSY